MARQAIHRYETPAISSRQSRTYDRTIALRCVRASVELKKHIDSIALGFVSQQSKVAILRWKTTTDDAAHFLADKGDE
jgi:hypothetical protein